MSHLQMILERHLLMGESLSASELAHRTEEEGGVQMLRGFAPLRFTMEEEDYYVHWELMKAK